MTITDVLAMKIRSLEAKLEMKDQRLSARRDEIEALKGKIKELNKRIEKLTNELTIERAFPKMRTYRGKRILTPMEANP